MEKINRKKTNPAVAHLFYTYLALEQVLVCSSGVYSENRSWASNSGLWTSDCRNAQKYAIIALPTDSKTPEMRLYLGDPTVR
jgi:hypothetical protein